MPKTHRGFGNLARTRRRRRTVRRTLYGNAVTQGRGIYCDGWYDAAASHASWQNFCAQMICGMVCCAFCACVGFGGVHHHKSVEPCFGIMPPACTFAPHMHAQMVTASGEWWQCHECCKSPEVMQERIAMLPEITMPYFRTVIGTPPPFLQSLALVDVSIDLAYKYHGFFSGQLSRKSIFDGPLVMLSQDTTLDPSVVLLPLQRILHANAQHNWLYHTYLSMLERSNNVLQTFPVAPLQSVARFMGQVQDRAPMAEEMLMAHQGKQGLGIIVDADVNVLAKPYSVFKVGNVVNRHHGTNIPAYVQVDGSPVLSGDDSLSIEMALFPYLFPKGAGYLRSTMHLGQYLKWRMTCLFSIFTMCKIYPLMMHQSKQLENVAKNVLEVHLEAEIYKYKKNTLMLVKKKFMRISSSTNYLITCLAHLPGIRDICKIWSTW